MKSHSIIPALLGTIFSFQISFSQDFQIEHSIQGNDSISFATLRYNRKEQGFAVISAKATTNWEIPFPSLILGMGKIRKNVVVFYTKEYIAYDYTKIKEIHAAIVGVKEKKILTDKVVYANESNHMIDPIIQNDMWDNFSSLIIRTTESKGVFVPGENYQQKHAETSGLTAIIFDDELKPMKKELKSIALGSNFITSCSGLNKEVFVTSFSDGQLATERFDSDGNLIAKLSVNASIKNKSTYYAIARYDSIQGNSINLAIRYKNDDKKEMLRVFKYNFNDKKTYADQETILNKDYIKSLQESQTEKAKVHNFSRIEDLQPVQILESSDKIIVLKEIYFIYTLGHDGAADRNTRDANVISIYSKDLHLIKEIVIDKTCETFITKGDAISGHIKDGKLYVVTCEYGGHLGTYKAVLSIINLSDGSMERRKLDRGDASGGYSNNPAAISWFSKNFVLPSTSAAAFIALKFKTALQSQNYQSQ